MEKHVPNVFNAMKIIDIFQQFLRIDCLPLIYGIDTYLKVFTST